MTLTRGRLGKTVKIIAVRELTREDLDCLKEKRTAPVVKRLRDPHHHLARLLASGVRPADCAAQSGYSMARLYTLQADPTFQDLVEVYRKDVHAAFVESQDDYHRLATSNMMKAERQIAEHLDKADETEELLPVRNLLAISRDAADRFGYSKKQTNINVNVDFAAKLEAAIKRSRGDNTRPVGVIEGNVVRRV